MGTFVQIPIIATPSYQLAYEHGVPSQLGGYNYKVAMAPYSTASVDISIVLAVAFRLNTQTFPLRVFVITNAPTADSIKPIAAESSNHGNILSSSYIFKYSDNVWIFGEGNQVGRRYFPVSNNDIIATYPEPFETIDAAFEQLSNSAAPEGFRNIRYNVTGAVVTGPSYLAVGDTATIQVSPNIGSTVTANNIEVIQAGNKIPFTYSNNKITFTVP